MVAMQKKKQEPAMSLYAEPLPDDYDWSQSTRQLHADAHLAGVADVAPPLHASTTFRYPRDVDQMLPLWGREFPPVSEELSSAANGHIYSRITAPTSTRFETVMGSIMKGSVVSYSTGVSAFHSLLVMLNPKRLAMSPGYSGSKKVAAIVSRMSGMKVLPLDCDAEELQAGDLVHVESPLNPTGEIVDIRSYVEKAHSRGAYVSVDAALGPPGLQDPFACGADLVVMSVTKYIGGHSDLLGGVVAVRRDDWHSQLWRDRMHLGCCMGNMESWLGLRSLRTLELRVQRQSKTATALVRWIHDAINADLSKASPDDDAATIKKVVDGVKHAAVQQPAEPWMQKQMPGGFGPVFSIVMKTEHFAKRLPSKLALFHHTCSFGSVDSLIEWRRLTDETVDARFLKVSIGLESPEDLKVDLLRAFRAVSSSPEAGDASQAAP